MHNDNNNKKKNNNNNNENNKCRRLSERLCSGNAAAC